MKQLVCDTGPLNYLIQIDAVGFLPALFQEIRIPHSVNHELIAHAAPPQVRAWSGQLPSWCRTLGANMKLEGDFHGLAEADLEVLSIASESKAAVLLDDLAARKAARRLGLPLLGTLRVLASLRFKSVIDSGAASRKLVP